MSIAYRHLGRSGVLVSPLCLGTMNFGWQTPKADSLAIMDRALDLGINFFDTADMYSGWSKPSDYGRSERIIGHWFAQGGGRRERVVLATKLCNPMPREDEGPEPNRDTRVLSALKIIRACEASLRRLGTDRIDLYQMHHLDRSCPWDEVWEAFETLVRQGKVVYVGSSNFAGWDLADAVHTARARRFLGLVSEQSVYNLRSRMIELEVIPACRRFGLGLIPWSPLAGGFLAGALARYDAGRRAGPNFQGTLVKLRPQLEPWEALCRELNQPPPVVALAWLLHNPVVTAPVIGPRTTDQLTGSVAALDMTLDDDTLEKLDEIWPGPGGEAPQAYW